MKTPQITSQLDAVISAAADSLRKLLRNAPEHGVCRVEVIFRDSAPVRVVTGTEISRQFQGEEWK